MRHAISFVLSTSLSGGTGHHSRFFNWVERSRDVLLNRPAQEIWGKGEVSPSTIVSRGSQCLPW
jgi:hypothetical protein